MKFQSFYGQSLLGLVVAGGFALLLAACSPRMTRLPIVQVRGEPRDLQASVRIAERGSVSMESLPEAIRRFNPHLRAARQAIGEAQGRLSQAGLPDNPNVQMSLQTDRQLGEAMLTAGISQRFPRTNRLAIEKHLNAHLVQAARAEVRNVTRLLISQARTELIHLLYLRSHHDLFQEEEATLRELAGSLKAAADRGEASFMDAQSALLEASKLKNEHRQLAIKAQFRLSKLKTHLGLRPDQKLEVTGELPPAKLPPQLVALARRPDLDALEHRTRSAEEEIRLEHARKYDDYQAGIFAGIGRREDAPLGFVDEQIVGVNFSIPLPTNDLNQGNIARAQARQLRLRLESEALSQNILAESQTSYAEMKQWLDHLAELDSTHLAIMEAQLKHTQEAYQQGEMPVQELIRAKHQLVTLTSTRLEALRDFHLAYNRYRTATNADGER